jgi:hypothetical protein
VLPSPAARGVASDFTRCFFSTRCALDVPGIYAKGDINRFLEDIDALPHSDARPLPTGSSGFTLLCRQARVNSRIRIAKITPAYVNGHGFADFEDRAKMVASVPLAKLPKAQVGPFELGPKVSRSVRKQHRSIDVAHFSHHSPDEGMVRWTHGVSPARRASQCVA